MKKCIYCRVEKEDNAFTLEHIIPQSLGGAYAPGIFQTRDVCKRCNSNLGLFVDAGFEKNWLVSNWLHEAAYAFFDPETPTGLPLRCMGNTDLTPPAINAAEVCECWLGPLGEQVYWIRPHDERLYWYAGGNPRTAKEVESRAYFLFSERSLKNPMISWLAFRDAFEGKFVRKLMCTKIEGANPAEIGFSEPDDLDSLRIDYLNHICLTQEKVLQNHLSIYTQFDLRFLAKLGLGISYAFFGIKALSSIYAEELYKALWFRKGDVMPLLQGTPAFAEGPNQMFKNLTGEQYAVTFIIAPSAEGIATIMNIGTAMTWTVMCASYEGLAQDDVKQMGYGVVLVLFKYAEKAVYLPLLDYVAHKCGSTIHPVLSQIAASANRHKDYFRNL